MTPPAHICGPNLTRAARDERDRWIAAAPRHLSNARIAALLGISPAAVLHACPDRSGKIPVRVMPPTTAAVSLPPVPGIEITTARPETDPRAGIVSPEPDNKTIADDDRPATVGFVLRHLRSLHAEVADADQEDAA